MMLVAAYAATGSLYAQSSSTIGTEFWFGFMPNHNQKQPSDRITLVAASPTPTTITVETYRGDSTSMRTEVYQLIPANFGDTIGSMTIELDPIISETRTYETPVYRSVHVSSNAPISLSAYNYKRGSGEGMLVLPVTTYGKEYRSLNYPTYRGEGETYSGQFIIVSPFDDNIVTIKTKAFTENSSGVESHVPESSWQVQLRKGQTYLVRSSTKLGTNITDLTGSHITSTRPVAVISGHQYAKFVNEPFGSTFFEMIPPVESWSRKYHYANFDPERRSTVVIVAADTGQFYFTTESTSEPDSLFPGQRREEEVFYNEGLYAISSSNSRFIAYELHRSKNITTDIKNYPPSMTILTSPDDRDNMFIQNYPPLFDSSSGNTDIAEQTIFYGHRENLLELFPNAKNPDLHYIPRTNLNFGYKTSSGYVNAHTRSFFNRVPISSMLIGTNGSASFGHTGSLRYTKRSTDLKRPYITANSSYCGNYDILVTDDVVTSPLTVESGMLASVRVITQEHDITMLPASRNYRIVRTNDFTFGSQTDNFKLEVINPQLDAFAAVYVEDLAGNDTTYIFTYTAGKTPLFLLKGTGNKIPVGKQVCMTLPIFPKGDSSSAPVLIESVRLKNGLSNPTLQSVWPTLPATFDNGDTLFVTICANAQDTAFFVSDSLLVFADCYERSYPVNVKGATGLLDARDKTFFDKLPNQRYSSTVQLDNIGDVPLWVTGFTIEGSPRFTVASNFIPKEIPKKGFQKVDIFYEPTAYGAKDTATIFWKTDVNAPYDNSVKTFTTLSGSTLPLKGVRDESHKTLSISLLTPNPAKDYLQLRYSSASKIMMTITNELGNEALKFELMPSEGPEASTRINLPQLPNGSYTLRLQNADGEVVSRRFVVVK
jgi:hypothetical protein